MGLNDVHNILFNAHILFSIALGIWSAAVALRNQSISGSFFGAVAMGAILAALVTLVGFIMMLQGLRPERMGIYYLYMAWLVVLQPGLFSLLHGRDDRSAAIAFSVLSFFNAATSFSMIQRNILGPWLPPNG